MTKIREKITDQEHKRLKEQKRGFKLGMFHFETLPV